MTLLEFFLSFPGMEKILHIERYPDTTVIYLDPVEAAEYSFLDRKTWRTADAYCKIREIFVQSGYWSTEYYLDDEAVRAMDSIQVVIDEGMSDWSSIYKYPDLRAVGGAIPPDRLAKLGKFGWDHLSGFESSDGPIDILTITAKWPDVQELFWDILKILWVYPQLDVTIAVMHTESGHVYPDTGGCLELDLARLKLQDLLELISIGFWVHDRTIEVLAPARAKQKLAEYVSRHLSSPYPPPAHRR